MSLFLMKLLSPQKKKKNNKKKQCYQSPDHCHPLNSLQTPPLALLEYIWGFGDITSAWRPSEPREEERVVFLSYLHRLELHPGDP